ncbi:DUF4397 domain-containing protein [bacterium]|nr:DUF4397 domain-containing protein [bacterium]
MKIRVFVLFLLLSVAALSACSGSSELDFGSAKFRLLHLIPDSSAIQVEIDGSTEVEDLRYLEVSEYRKISSGTQLVEVSPLNSFLTYFRESKNFRDGREYSIFAVGLQDVEGDEEDVDGIFVEDDNDKPDSGNARIRIINAIPENQLSLDVYVTAPETNPDTIAPSIDRMRFKDVTDYLEAPAGIYKIHVRNDQTNVDEFITSPIELADRRVYTIALVTSRGGDKPYNALVVRDR